SWLMPPTGPLPERIAEVKTGLAARWEPLVDKEDGDALQRVLTYEPVQAPPTPLLTMMFAGYRRRGLETPELQTAPIRDPIGGRIWIFNFDVRLWVDLVSDEEAAQRRTDALVPVVVAALEEDPSLGSLAVDSAMSSGDTHIMSPQQGQALLIHTCKCSVEIEESV
ncbi:MAG TPA: hypothetical protein VG458_07600, partial [Solirubrobacterales bacterium]|nr:hypothetical protein [Solirubrobacterales bacterium]